MGTLQQPGPGFFPFLAGTILGILSVLNLLKAIAKKEPGKEDLEKLGPGKKWKNISLTLAILFAYPLMLRLMGFAFSTFILFVVLLRFIEPLRWSIVLRVAGGVAILTFLIFQYFLKIQFPKGIFGI